MIRQTLDFKGVTPMNRVQIEYLADVAGRFSSTVLLEHKNRVINGKSMLGLLSLGDTGDEQVTLICEGKDEQEAAEAIVKQLRLGVTPPKSAADGFALLNQMKDRCVSILGEKLVGMYLHGSLASGGFGWNHSDIDFLIVVKKSLDMKRKLALTRAAWEMEKEGPAGGVEMSVVTEDACRQVPYPMPFDLHYSAMHREEFEHDPEGFCQRMQGTDPDLTTHILSLRASGRAILGPDIARAFGQVKREDAAAAIRQGVRDAEKELHERPVYWVLTLCRSVAYLREGKALTKQEAGQWALRRIPQEYQPLIQAALNAYETGLDMTYDEAAAEDFCRLALKEIQKESPDEGGKKECES